MFQWDIIGHQKQLQEFERDIETGNVAHAYLVAGPSQVGKFTTMKRLAHMLQCEQRFCRHCSTCLEIAKGYHSDTIEIADDGESIKIEAMREVLNKISTTAQSPHKIILIKNIERMTPESANALLKTLEDPPSKVKFLFTTSNLPSILSTILSRVRLSQFQTLPEADLIAFLQGRYPQYAPHELTLGAAFALGKVGKALSLLENADLFRTYQGLYEQVSALLENSDRVDQFHFVADIMKTDHQVDDFLIVFLATLRQKFLESTLSGNGKNTRKWLAALEQYQQLQEMRRRNVNERMLLENLMLAL